MSQFFTSCQQRIGAILTEALPEVSIMPSQLHQAMRYSTLNGGKRIRALLVYATAAGFQQPLSLVDHVAGAVEMVHAYSLIHDDLPAMDDDDLRRGKPSCHKAFDEASAILAGDALQSLAFEFLAQSPNSAEEKVLMIQLLAQAIGSRGMAGGQSLDLAAEGQHLKLEQLQQIHQGKTGALIAASVDLAAIACQSPAQCQRQLHQFATHIGLAFQIQDDILDVEAQTSILGKPAGSDEQADKATYPKILGLAQAKKVLTQQHQLALDCLEQTHLEFAQLRQLADYIIQRNF